MVRTIAYNLEIISYRQNLGHEQDSFYVPVSCRSQHFTGPEQNAQPSAASNAASNPSL